MISNSLSKISEPIKKELGLFEDYFDASMRSKIKIVDLIARYIIRQKGKKIRPTLVFLSANMANSISDRTYRGAILVELLHTATLVHDDVVDNSDKRRGFWSINAVFKNKIAVLMGDYLLARGLNISVENDDFDFLKVMTNTVKRMSEGELHQIQKTRKLDIDEESYYQIIADKTASLLETCCRIGALSSTDDTKKIDALTSYGYNLGMAFQITDDILDYNGKSSFTGKPVGGDIKEKKITLPLIYSMQQVAEKEVKDIKTLLKNKKDNSRIKTIINFVNKNNGLEKALKKANEFGEAAKRSLDIFEDSEIKNSLSSLVDFVIERKK